MENNNIPENNNPETNENTVPENTEANENTVPENSASPENEENGANVDFSAKKELDTVKINPESKKNKKLPIIIIVCVLVIAIVAGVIVYAVKKGGGKPNGDNIVDEPSSAETLQSFDEQQLMSYFDKQMSEGLTNEEGVSISKEEYIADIQQKVQEATTVLSTDVGNSSHYVITENTTAPITNGTTASDKDQVDKAQAQIKAFFNRSCYMRGALYADGVGDPMSMAFDGDNFEVLTNLDGTEVSILRLDGTLYLKRPALKQYVELTDSVMDVIGISADDFNFSFGTKNYDDMKSKLIGTYDIAVDGANGVCHRYESEEQIFNFYSVDGELKQIDICDSDGVIDSQLTIDYFSESIPGDQLTLKGFESTGIMVLFADLM